MGQLIIFNETVMYSRHGVRGCSECGHIQMNDEVYQGKKIEISTRSEDHFVTVRYGVNQRKRLFSEEKMVGDVGIEPTTR